MVTKEFTTAAKAEEADEEKPLPFTLDGVELTIWPPKAAQLALMTAATSEYTEDNEAVATFITTFFSLLDPDSARHLRGRMFDRTDSFEIQDVMDIMMWASEQVAGRPTEPSPGSTPSRQTSGPSSTAPARRKASRSSRSASTSSATSSTRGSSSARKTAVPSIES
jgi:hypothetical protein